MGDPRRILMIWNLLKKDEKIKGKYTNMKDKRTEQLEEFIQNYKVALNLKWSLDKLALHLGVKPESIQRRALTVKHQTGRSLSPLVREPNVTLSADDIKSFKNEEYNLTRRVKRKIEKKAKGKKFVITSAQNATPVHSGFLASVLNYCDVNDAQLIVVPYRYKNPTSIWSVQNEGDEWWASEIVQYLSDDVSELANNLVLLGNIKVQPTASEPINGFEGFTGINSTIIGHPKIQFKTVPTLEEIPKIITTTGAITIPNYTDSKAGWKGAFHHNIAALIVEVDTVGQFHLRHIHGNLKTGHFYDLDGFYTDSKVTYGNRIEALVCGDIHAEFIDPDVEKATFSDKNSISNVLNPKHFIFHDLVDYYARCHHHKGNDVINAGKHLTGERNNVEEGLQMGADFIDRISRDGTVNVIVQSNHIEFLDRWLFDSDVKGDYENARFYHYMKYHQMKNIVKTNTGFKSIDPFEFWCKNPDACEGLRNTENTIFLNRDEAFTINDIELGFHGDMGINGARGDIKGLSKLSSKIIIGHSHSPGIHESVYQVGLSARLNLEYKRGPSSWLHTHAIIYPDGKRTLINIINGKWRA